MSKYFLLDETALSLSFENFKKNVAYKLTNKMTKAVLKEQYLLKAYSLWHI